MPSLALNPPSSVLQKPRLPPLDVLSPSSIYFHPIMTWSRLPLEVLETILTYLDLASIKALRLVDRELSVRCLGPHFVRHVRASTDLTRDNLASLDALGRNPVLRQHVHDLTIQAVYYAADEANVRLGRQPSPNDWREWEWTAPNLESDVDWLEKQRAAQEELSSEEVINSLTGTLQRFKSTSLKRITLDVSVVLGPGMRTNTRHGVWLETWTTASKVYKMTMAAVARSGIDITHLDIYRQTPNCAVFLSNYTRVGGLDWKAIGTTLQHLQLSLCTDIDDGTWEWEYGRETSSKVIDRTFGHVVELPRGNKPQAVPGLIQLLQATPNLRHLDLHLYRFPVNFDEYHSIFTALADQVTLPHLQSFALSGFPVIESSLPRFLSTHANLESLTLQEIHVVQGTWSPIFTYINNMASLTTVNLASLWWNVGTAPPSDDAGPIAAPKKLVNLHTTWDEQDPITPSKRFSQDGGDHFFAGPGNYIVHRRSFDQEDIRRGLVFRPTPKLGMGSARRNAWKNHRHQTYGPPEFNLLVPPRRG